MVVLCGFRMFFCFKFFFWMFIVFFSCLVCCLLFFEVVEGISENF